MHRIIYFSEFRFSLLSLDKDGLMERNFRLLEELLNRGICKQVQFFTYDLDDAEFLAKLHADGRLPKGFSIVKPPRFARSRTGSLVYSLFGPILHHRIFRNATILHTEQVSGAWTALIGRLLFSTPLFFRCGYPLSIRFLQERKKLNYWIAILLENLLVRFSQHVGVTSSTMKSYYSSMDHLKTVTILPNYVDLSIYAPVRNYDKSTPILFVGRLVEVKNISALIRACAAVETPLHIYGDGPLKQYLTNVAQECGASVEFMGVVQNTELASRHHNYCICVSCSVREGLPKSVVEAMASGLIMIGTKTDGLRELIQDGVTGYLVDGFDAAALASKIAWVQQNLDPAVGQAARRFVEENYSLESAVVVTEQILRDISR